LLEEGATQHEPQDWSHLKIAIEKIIKYFSFIFSDICAAQDNKSLIYKQM
jgi:hypothetical protein